MTSIAYAALVLFVFSVPWEDLILVPGVGTGSRLFGLVAFPFCLIAIVSNGRVFVSWPVMLLTAFVALAAISLLWAADVEASVVALLTYVQLLAMTWMATQIIDSETKLHGAFMAFIFGSYFAALKAIEAYTTGVSQGHIRYTAVGMGANDTAIILSIAIAMAGYLAVCRCGWWRLVSLVYLPLGAYGVLLSASRAGFLAMLIAIPTPVLLMLRPRHYAKAVALGLVGLMAGSVLLVRYVPESSWDRIATIESEVAGEGNLSGRLVIWGVALDMINEAPILGLGVGSFKNAMQRLGGMDKSAHNGFLAIAAQHGVVGLLIVIAAWGLVVREVLSMPARERRAWYTILAVLLMAVMSLNWEGYKTTWLLFAMALVHARYVRPHRTAAVAPDLMPVTVGRSLHRS